MSESKNQKKKILLIALAVILVIAAFCAVLYFNSLNKEEEEVSLLKSFDEYKQEVISGSKYSKLAEKYAEYLEELNVESEDSVQQTSSQNGDDSLIKVYAKDYTKTVFTYSIYNGNSLFYSGYISLKDADNEETGHIDVSLVSPYSYKYGEVVSESEPSNFVLEESVYYDFTYLKPDYEYSSYVSYDNDGYYTMYYSANANISEENFENLAKRQFALCALNNDCPRVIYFLDSDNNEMNDYGSYKEYKTKQATYKAVIDLDNKTITLYTFGKKTFEESAVINVDD